MGTVDRRAPIVTSCYQANLLKVLVFCDIRITSVLGSPNPRSFILARDHNQQPTVVRCSFHLRLTNLVAHQKLEIFSGKKDLTGFDPINTIENDSL
jgi:hypothetical protein